MAQTVKNVILCLPLAGMILFVSFFSGCGAGQPGNELTGGATLSEEQKILQTVQNMPYKQDVDFSESLPGGNGRHSHAASASRKASALTRTLTQVSLVGSCCAKVTAAFNLTGSLTFLNDKNEAVTEKIINLSSVFDTVYEVVKNAQTDGWDVVFDPSDELELAQGTPPAVSSVQFSPDPALPGQDITITAQLSSLNSQNDYYATFQCKSLGVKVQLFDSGAAPDVTAADGIYTGKFTLSATASKGSYSGFLDIVDKTSSLDLTEQSTTTAAFFYPYTGVFHAEEIRVSDSSGISVANLAVSCKDMVMKKDEATYCQATETLSDGSTSEVFPQNVQWSLSPSSSGSITRGGIVTASAEGQLTVTGVIEGITGNTVSITVETPVQQAAK